MRYKGARYIEAAPPPTPSAAIPDETKKEVCQILDFLSRGTAQTKKRLDASGLSDPRMDQVIEIFDKVGAAAEKVLGSGCTTLVTSTLRRAMVRFAAPPPVPAEEKTKVLQSIMKDIKLLAGSAVDTKKMLVQLGLQAAEKPLMQAKTLLSDIFSDLMRDGAKRIQAAQ